MNHIIQLLLFLLINAAGFYVLPLLVNLMLISGFSSFSGDPQAQLAFSTWLVRGGVLVWLASAFASLGYFLVNRKRLGRFLLLAPLYVPFLFGIFASLYYMSTL